MKRLLIFLIGMALIASACSDSETHVPVTGQLDSGEVTAMDEATGAPQSAAALSTDPETEDRDGDVAEPEPGAEEVNSCRVADRVPAVLAGEGLLPVDPAVRIGSLDNGLTYYARSNDSPGGTLSLRLVVNAGSFNEPFAGANYAHFLEHMLFNGTEKYPGNEVINALESIGVEFGPDINAYTSYDETVYMLDLVIDEEEDSVGTAFEVLSQWAHAATIDPEDVEEERGIVRDEYRLRDESGQGNISSVFDRMYEQGTPYEGRAPGGTVESIEATTAEDLRNFYETWYVPSNMAVVAVGDLPVDTLEDLVEEYFCDIPAGDDPPAVDNRSALNPEAKFDIATSPDQSYPYLSLDIRLPSWDPSTIEGDRQLWIEEIISIMVGNRLQDGYEQGFLSQIDPTHWLTFSHTRGLRFYGTNLRADDFSAALTDYWSLLLSLELHGFSDADLERAAKAIRADLESAIEAEPTSQDRQRADQYAGHFLGGADIGRLEDTAARVDALLDGLEVEDLTDRYREILADSGPILIAVGPDPTAVPTVEEMRAAVDAAVPGELPEMIAEVSELLSVPDPVDPVSEGPIEAVADEFEDAYEWTFANGARVMFAYSDTSENEVLLDASSWGGWSALSEGDRPLAQYLATSAVRSSGLGEFSPAQISRYLDDRNARVQPYIAETYEGFSGSSDTVGAETMFQLMHLYMTAYRVDEQAFAEAANIGDIIVSASLSNPDWQEDVAYLETRFGDSFGWFNPVPSREVLDSLTAEALLSIYEQRFGGVDDLEVIVVGDVDREVVDELARTYVGTLPAKEADSYVNRRIPEPDGVLRREIVLGPDNESTTATYRYEAALEVNPETQVATRVLDAILDKRLVEDIREDLGDTYVVYASLGRAFSPESRVTAQITATGAPDQMDNIEAEMARILAEVHAGQITAEEFETARATVEDNYVLIGNADLVNVLVRRIFTSDDELPTPKRLIAELEQLDLADVQELAALLLDPDQHIQTVRVLP